MDDIMSRGLLLLKPVSVLPHSEVHLLASKNINCQSNLSRNVDSAAGLFWPQSAQFFDLVM